jgi:putative membrane protein
MILSARDQQSITARVVALEKALGVEVVTLVAAKSDTYPEAVWKAFALGASLTALAVVVAEVVRPDWASAGAVLSAAMAILAAGATSALATVYVLGFARLFVRASRQALEVTQHARAQFVERGLSATRPRTAVLLLASLLERRVVIVADRGLDALVSQAEWDGVIAQVTARLAEGEIGAALLAGLDAIEALLAGKGVPRGDGNAFADAPIEETGA